MQKIRLIFTALLVPVDFAMLIAAGLAAYWLRFTTPLTEVLPVIYEIPFKEYFQIILGVSLLWIIIFAIGGLYTIRPDRRFFSELGRIILSCSAGIMAVIVVMFFVRELFSSRFIVLTAWVLSIVFIAAGRRILHLIEKTATKQGLGLQRVILIGDSWAANNLADIFRQNPSKGFAIAYRFSRFDDGTERQIKEILATDSINEIILADPLLDRKIVSQILEFSNAYHLEFRYVPDVFGEKSFAVETQLIGYIPLLHVKRTSLDGWGRIAKRCFDIAGAVFGLIVLFPLFLIIALFVKFNSAGPVFARLKRVGQSGNFFYMYKFRSMIDNAHILKKDLMAYNERKEGPLFKMMNDPRVTSVGRILRKTSLDELPQLINVLKGDMSLVGPRAHEPEEVSQYSLEQRKLLTIRPGMTGLPQISGRDKLNFSREAQLDIFYIEHWSLKLDLIILLKTPFAVVFKPAA